MHIDYVKVNGMTLNKLIARLQSVAAEGHGDKEVIIDNATYVPDKRCRNGVRLVSNYSKLKYVSQCPLGIGISQYVTIASETTDPFKS